MRGKVVGDAFGLGLEGKGAPVGLSEVGRVVRGPRDSNSESDSSVLPRRSLCAVGGEWEAASSSLVETGLKGMTGTRGGLPGSSLRVGGDSC